MRYAKGDRVRVVPNWNWEQACTGQIAEPPAGVVELTEEDGDAWNGCRRTVQSLKGPIEFYWVVFDQPQRDGDGDGPYLAGEVEEEYLQLTES